MTTNEADRVKYVAKGDSFRRELTAAAWNSFADAANFVKLGQQRDPLNFKEDYDRPSLVDVVAHAPLSRLEVLGLDDIGISQTLRDGAFEDIQRPDFLSAVPTSSHLGKFALAIDGAETADDVSRSVIAGAYACKLFVPADGDWIARADVDTSDNTRLLSTPNGSAQILWKDTGVNTTVDAIVRLGNPQNVSLVGKTLTNVDPNTTGDVRIWLNRTTDTNYDVPSVHLDWMHNNQPISQDKEVHIKWFPEENLWRFVGAECEELPPAIGQLGDTGLGTLQSLTTTPVAWNSFDASEDLSTANVTLDAANATITLPANPTKQDVYRFNYSGVLTPGSPNVTYQIDFTINGVAGPPLLVDGRQAGSSLSFSAGGQAVFPINATPNVVQARIAMVAGTDTINWNSALFSMERNLDFQ